MKIGEERLEEKMKKKKRKNDPTRLLCGRICGVARTITYCLPSSSDRYIIQRFPVTAVAAAASPKASFYNSFISLYVHTDQPHPANIPTLLIPALHPIRCL
ncbi:unnamed protein product [Macrosiphum euphorbiae]|uniref:Uncharacterized protein n=1 Tax=Macrosiphum euphorbiae TaxID=13131 RepID=A0AAV0VYF5_9HEMI|nr:unnamed protein product [Macrosiphum euphorbiae]